MKSKKILSLFLAFVMVFGMIPTVAFAEEAEPPEASAAADAQQSEALPLPNEGEVQSPEDLTVNPAAEPETEPEAPETADTGKNAEITEPASPAESGEPVPVEISDNVQGAETDEAFENEVMQSLITNDNATDSLIEGDSSGKVSPVKSSECNVKISKPDEVFEGDNTHLQFSFEFNKPVGESYTEGEQIELPTNIGELFEADWENNFSGLTIKGENEEVLATADIRPDKIVITISASGAGYNYFAGMITTQSLLIAKKSGAAADKNVVKALTIGCASKDVTFKYRNNRPGSSDGPVDVDSFWKSGWKISSNMGAGISFEVNPIASMELYGSTTYKDAEGNYSRKPLSHKNLFVEDPIPEHGFIDPDSVQIYAAVPTIGVRDTDFIQNSITVPAGVYYAVRQGTLRHLLNNYGGNTDVVMTRLEQQSGETIDTFRNRLKEKQLQWGIYRDEATGNETFLCNFGNVGKFDDGTQNNGILYKKYNGQGYYEKYPEIFGENGASAGNIVSYYVEFNTYYPDIVGEKQVTNRAYMSSDNLSEQWRHASYTINNGDGTGIVRRSELKLKLVDEADKKTPIANAEFRLLRWENESWQETVLTGLTDENGNLTFGPLPPGKYKVEQLSTANGYRFDNTTYGSATGEGNSNVNNIGTDGVFQITRDDKWGFGSVVTNKRIQYNVNFKFVASDGKTELPEEVIRQLPTMYRVYEGENAAVPADLELKEVKTDAGTWSFKAWDKTEVQNVSADVLFTGTWTFAESAMSLNIAPEIEAKDLTLNVGDKFSPQNGVKATDREDGDITDKVEVIENNVDMSKAGKYKVTYKVTDSDGACTVKTINVTVKAKAPVKPVDPPSDKPKTGDESTLLHWFILCMMSACALTAIPLFVKKKGKR